jgi:hypothetical protein
MAQQPSLRDIVWAALYQEGAPAGSLLEEDGADLIVRYPDHPGPEWKDQKAPGRCWFRVLNPDPRLEPCKRILEQDRGLVVELIEWRDLHALRITTLAPHV